MAQNRFIRNVSANSLQLVINQVFGLAIFYVLSQGLSKDIFGSINWSLAVLLTVFAVLTFGMDQLTVKKIAAGGTGHRAFSAYLFHVLISGTFFYALLLLCFFLFPHLFLQRSFLLFIGAGKLMIFFSTPFKQLAAGLEKFNKLFWMSIVSNILRGGALLILLLLHQISVGAVLIIFIAGDVAELAVSVFIARPIWQARGKIQWDKNFLSLLLKESIPQAGVVICTAVMARFDWILIGWLVSESRLAEYSFAWKVFEVSTLPLLIIAPIMIPLFTRLAKLPGTISRLSFFLEWQIIIASFIALMLSVCWTPLIDAVTAGKYGAVNANTVFLLSLGMPVLYLNNYLWTINFAEGKLKLIFFIMAASFGVNIISCSILIPIYKNEGAAFANLLTLLTQLGLYFFKTPFFMPANRRYILFVWPCIAVLSGFAAQRCFGGGFAAMITAAGIFIIAVLVSKSFRFKDRQTFRALYQ